MPIFRFSMSPPRLPGELVRQLPFITSLAVNELAKAAQAAEHAHIAERFIVRRPQFTLRAIKIKPFATKQMPVAVLQVEPPGGPARADILAKFEKGGVKVPTGESIAIPDAARRTKAGIVSRAQRPKAFQFRFQGRGPKARVWRGERRTFLIKTTDGVGVIFQRVARRGRSAIRRLFALVPRAAIPARLDFVATVTKTIQQGGRNAFVAAIARAMQSVRR